jgi:hypothetical protein
MIDEGFRPLLLKDYNYIEFKIDRTEIRIQFYEDGDHFIQLGCWVCNYKQEDKNDALNTANHVNIYTKCAYIALHSNQIIAHSDIFVDDSISVKTLLFRYISAVLYARDEFYRITDIENYSLN